MTRRRSPEHDYICQRCLCACNVSGTRHEGGGSADFRACEKPPIPVLRRDFRESDRRRCCRHPRTSPGPWYIALLARNENDL